MTYRVCIVYGSLCSRSFTVSAANRVDAIHAASDLSMQQGLPWVRYWQPPFYSVDEVVERPRNTEPVRVLKMGVCT